MIALLDGDIISYRVGFTTEDAPVQIAMSRVDSFIARVLNCIGTDKFKCFITSSKPGYRFQLYPEYKANRKTKKPLWYQEIREHLRVDYDAEECFPIEADDALGINQTEHTCICTIDKDLDQVPGAHFDYVKEVQYDVSKERGLRFFYHQMLTGDRVDNIPGVYGIGPVKASKILGDLTTEEEYALAVLEAYEGDVNRMTLMGQLLRIQQCEGEPLWQIPAEVVSKYALKTTSKETK